MANDLFLEFVFVLEGMSLELLPCCALRFGDRSCIVRVSSEFEILEPMKLSEARKRT